MAKKPKAARGKAGATKKKPTTKKGAKRGQSRADVERVLGSGPRRRKVAPPPPRPKDRALPGLEDVKNIPAELLRIMDTMGDTMARINEDQATLKGLRQNALAVMKKHHKTVCKAHGIELVIVPGDEKVRARLVSGEGATDHSEPEPTEEGTTRDETGDEGAGQHDDDDPFA